MKQKLIIKAKDGIIKVRAKTDATYVLDVIYNILHREMQRMAPNKELFDLIKEETMNVIDRMQYDGTITEDEC